VFGEAFAVVCCKQVPGDNGALDSGYRGVVVSGDATSVTFRRSFVEGWFYVSVSYVAGVYVRRGVGFGLNGSFSWHAVGRRA
jgi:hypothetical protein